MSSISRRRIAVIVLTVFVLGSVFVAPVAGQVVPNTTGADAGNNSSAPSPAVGANSSGTGAGVGNNSSTGANASGNSSGGGVFGNGGGGSSGGGGILGGGGVVPSAGDWLSDAAQWAYEDIQGGLEGYVNALNAAFVGVATPGEVFDPATWFMPENGLWGTAAPFYMATSFLSVPLFAGALVAIFDVESRQKQREMLKTLGECIAGTVLGMPLLALYFHTINIFSTGIAPSGTEFIGSAGGIAQLTIGHLILIGLAIINTGVVVIGGLIMFAIHFSPIVLYTFWPLTLASKAFPVRTLQSTSNLGLTALGLLPVLRISQSLLLRLAKMLTWTDAGIGAQIGSLFGTMIILVVALLVLPYVFWRNLETASGMALSKITVRKSNRAASTANNVGTRAAAAAGGRAKQAGAPYVNSARSTAAERATNAKRRVGSRVGGAILTAKYGRPGSGSTSGGGTSSSSASGPGPRSSSTSSRAASSNDSGGSSDSARRASTDPEPRRRAINRARRDARKRRQHRGDD